MITINKIKQIFTGRSVMNIKKTDLVLEIGSGHNPFYRSDILVDKYVEDNLERESSILIDRPFLVADACKLPFKNQSFNYIICRHVLEHLENPSLFFKELMRVGKAGYIETPSPISETLFGWPYHLWFVNKQKNTLVLTAKQKQITIPIFENIFHNFYQNDKNFHYFFENHHNLFFTMYEWQKKINFKINQNIKINKFKKAKINTNHHQVLQKKISISLQKQLIYKFLKLYKKITIGNKKIILENLLACPKCKKNLTRQKNCYFCHSCFKRYQIIKQIPILL